MRRTTAFRLLVMVTLLWTTRLGATPLSFESGPRKTHLLELFTSEGCSSCPPAEAWVSGLKDRAGLWRDFVPVAFHVDYWDRLGWRDPFASKAWTARQYEYAKRWHRNGVYTPGFVLDGREWTNPSVPVAATESPGTLTLALLDGARVAASFRPVTGDNRKPLELHVARLGFGFTSHVKAGENRGRQLRHDFVVLALDTAKLVDGKAELTLGDAPREPDAIARGAIGAWVTEPGYPEPIQAVGGWVP